MCAQAALFAHIHRTLFDVEAMAGFDGASSADESLNAAPLSTGTLQQTFLTTPHA